MVALKSSKMTMGACTPVWDISVIARMPQKGITMKIKAGVILGQQLVVHTDRFLETIDESCYPVTGRQMIIREQEAAGVCYLCAKNGHTFINCPRLKPGGPQNKGEQIDSGIVPQLTCKTYQGFTRSGKIQSWILELPCTNKLELVSGFVTQRRNLQRSKTRKLPETIATWTGKASGAMTWRLLTRNLARTIWRSSISAWKLSDFSGRLIVS
jgi:hypothetical protein